MTSKSLKHKDGKTSGNRGSSNSEWRSLMPKQRGVKYKHMLSMPIAKKIFKDLIREKTILFAIFLQLFIILTSSIIITNANTLFNPDKIIQEPIHIAITGDSYVRNKLIPYFEDTELIALVTEFESDALQKFETGDVDAVLVANKSKDIYPIYLNLILPKGDVKGSVIASEVKNALHVYENEIRDNNLAEPDAIRLDKLKLKSDSNSITTQVFEALYSILIPFLLLLPGVLLGGLVIDIIIEEMETKTLNILMIITTFRKYVFEILLAVTGLSMLQVLTWELLLVAKGIIIHNLPYISVLIMFLNFMMFIACVLLTLFIKEKTRAQVIYSFIVILLFSSAPIIYMNPIRVITRLSIGLESVPMGIYYIVLLILTGILFGVMNFAISKKEW